MLCFLHSNLTKSSFFGRLEYDLLISFAVGAILFGSHCRHVVSFAVLLLLVVYTLLWANKWRWRWWCSATTALESIAAKYRPSLYRPWAFFCFTEQMDCIGPTVLPNFSVWSHQCSVVSVWCAGQTSPSMIADRLLVKYCRPPANGGHWCELWTICYGVKKYRPLSNPQFPARQSTLGLTRTELSIDRSHCRRSHGVRLQHIKY